MAGQLVISFLLAVALLLLTGAFGWLANNVVALGLLLEQFMGGPLSVATIVIALTLIIWGIVFKIT